MTSESIYVSFKFREFSRLNLISKLYQNFPFENAKSKNLILPNEISLFFKSKNISIKNQNFSTCTSPVLEFDCLYDRIWIYFSNDTVLYSFWTEDGKISDESLKIMSIIDECCDVTDVQFDNDRAETIEYEGEWSHEIFRNLIVPKIQKHAEGESNVEEINKYFGGQKDD
jgi:hypothetical protein